MMSKNKGGRPRTRLRLDELRGARIDADELRRRAKADGVRLDQPGKALVRSTDTDRTEHTTSVPIQVLHNAAGYWRWYLLCPRCGHRRRFLYAVGCGVSCHVCLRLGRSR
jgi:hypothetical protein